MGYGLNDILKTLNYPEEEIPPPQISDVTIDNLRKPLELYPQRL